MSKPILCLDFDGCIHSYKSGWKGVTIVPDPPVPGVFEWMERTLQHFSIFVYSSRSSEPEGVIAMYQYVKLHAPNLVDELTFTHEKPRAFIQIDDRCVCFHGDWYDPKLDPENILKFVPWYKEGAT